MKSAFFAALCLSHLLGTAQAQRGAVSCVLVGGTTLAPKFPAELFLTEGPITAMDTTLKTISAMGRVVTIPDTCDFFATDDDGNTVTENRAVEFETTATSGDVSQPLTAQTMDLLSDSNAAPGGASTTADFSGAFRSILGTDADDGTASIQDAWRNFIVAAGAGLGIELVYPSDFYPPLLGGTFKSAGSVYVDSVGQEYNIPDQGLVVELSENVALGTVTAVHQATRSFAMGSLIIKLNQDPRFGAEIFGGPLSTTLLPEEVFFNGLTSALSTLETADPTTAAGIEAIEQATGLLSMGVVGYNVGADLLLAQFVESTIFDENAPPIVAIGRADFRDNQNRIDLLASIDQPLKVNLGTWQVRLLDANGVSLLQDTLTAVIDPLTGTGEAAFRTRGAINTSQVRTVELSVVTAESAVIITETWARVGNTLEGL
jgi:hypothetical protein